MSSQERIKDYQKTSEILKALGHPVRLQIVDGLMNDECNVGKIVELMKLPQSTISQHLGILRSRGILYAERINVKTCYHIKDDRVKKIIEILRK